jgi:hypothetical protein
MAIDLRPQPTGARTVPQLPQDAFDQLFPPPTVIDLLFSAPVVRR